MCSSHFSKEDFKKDFKHEFGISSRGCLIVGAIPRFNIPTIMSSKQTPCKIQKSEREN